MSPQAGFTLEPNRAELARFVHALFLHAGEGGYVSLRAFYDDKKSGVFGIQTIQLNGSGLEPVIAAAAQLARKALETTRPVVVCPPIATFRSEKADEDNLLEGLALSVELDQRPKEALVTLRRVIGLPTLVIESGGLWIDPETGEIQPKLHIHWRLVEATQTPEVHARLKQARTLACELVSADPSNNTAVHPIRWPGTVHRKNPEAPRLCRIAEEIEAEITLEDALERLEQALGARRQHAEELAKSAPPKAEGNPSGIDFNARANGGGMGRELLIRAAELIPNSDCDWHVWNTVGMAFFAETDGSADGFAAFTAWSRKSQKYTAAGAEERWRHWRKHPPTRLTGAKLTHLAREIDPDFYRAKESTSSEEQNNEHKSEKKAGEETTAGTKNEEAGNEETKTKSNAAQWPDPKPLPVGLPNVDPLDPSLLPKGLRAWALDIAERMQCPPDYIAVPAVVSLSSAIGRQIGIRPKRRDDWLVVPNLWGGVVGPPGVLKTPAQQEATRPLVRLEMDAKARYEEELKLHEAEKKLSAAEKKLQEKELQSRLKKGENRDVLLAELMEDPNERDAPARQRFLINDSTVEKLGEILRDSPNGVLVLRDELTGWLRGLDREGREGDRAFYLEAWNGAGRFTYDRIGRGTVEIEAACVSMLGSIQPGPLTGYLSGIKSGGTADDGLLQRFQLLVWPDAAPKWRNVDEWPDRVAREQAFNCFEACNSIKPERLSAEQPEDGIAFLRFDKDAQDEFDTWRTNLEERLRSRKLHPAFEAHLSKYRSLVPSLALIFHIVDGSGGPVSLEALLRAEAWTQYLETHAARIYSVLLNSSETAATELGKRILTGELCDPFTPREVQRHHWSGLNEREEVSEAIDLLEDLDWIATRTIKTGGRPKLECHVNPKLREAGREQ